MACQTITGLLLAATALLHGCASAPAEAEPSVAGDMDPSPASLGPYAALPGAADASPSVVPQPGGGGKPALEPLPAEAAPAQPIVVVESGPAERSGIGVERPETLESPESLGSSGPLPADEPSGEGGPGPEAPTGLEAPEAVAETGDLAQESAPSVETADGLTMQFEVIGQGRPVVLIHGWCGNGEQWAATASALVRSYRVYSVDLVGHGASAAQARTRWTIASYGDDVARLLEREGLRDAVLIGHSMGGPVALEAAVRAPDRVGAVVGVESLHRLAGEADPERMAPYVARFKEDFPAAMGEFTSALVRAETPPETRARIVADSVQCDPEMAVALVEHFGTYDPKPATRIIDSPVRCINAEVTPTDVAGNRALLPSFDAVLLPETGHWPHLESPARFQAALDRLLVEVAPVPDPGSEARILTLGPTIRCEDVQATLEFYTQRLRFEEVECEPGEERPAGEAVTLVRDGATVVLQSLGGLREDLPEVTLRPGPAILRLEVTNLTAELAALGDALRVVVPERRLASGARQVVIEDPAGSLVILRQARERL
jgi:pimeloyl-ACP methyl ester carboxylesterase/catechol 2,3-dioxygenase-like lactoylglutathione lyase family enzyme